MQVEKAPQDLAREFMLGEFMLGEVMAAAMRQLRALDKPWLRLPEEHQKRVIDEVREACSVAIRKAVEIIATDDRTRFSAQVESVTFKDGVKAVLTMTNSQASHELADTAGGRVFVVIEDPNRYTQSSPAIPQADPDQPSLG